MQILSTKRAAGVVRVALWNSLTARLTSMVRDDVEAHLMARLACIVADMAQVRADCIFDVFGWAKR